MNRAAESAASVWFIQAAGRVWGPYPDARMTSFIEEGRVAADTLVGSRADGPFAPASHQLRLRRLFGMVEEPEPAPKREREIAARRPEPAPTPTPAEMDAGAVLPLLVFTTLDGARADSFEGLLGAHGPYVRIQPGLWLVRAPMSPASLRNVLTRRMQASDSVMVVAAPPHQAAWFNLDGETDRSLRQLWIG